MISERKKGIPVADTILFSIVFANKPSQNSSSSPYKMQRREITETGKHLLSKRWDDGPRKAPVTVNICLIDGYVLSILILEVLLLSTDSH